MYRQKKLPSGEMETYTYTEVNGNYEDNVLVYWYLSPAEPDVNWPGGVDIHGVYGPHEPENLINQMTQSELDDLEVRLLESLPSPEDEY